MLSKYSKEVRQYLLITGNYWAFTLTDGALRMLVVLYFHQLGYTPIEIAMLFLFYEFFGVVTNLVGGWLGARLGLNSTMNLGLFLQIIALAMLAVPSNYLTVVWVMCAQALSGIAKDLNKMSAKSAIKLLVPEDARGALFRWVAILTGSKNSLKGIGFFMGAVLLSAIGFQNSVLLMMMGLAIVFCGSLIFLKQSLGKSSKKPKLRTLFSKKPEINRLSAARFFLFAARDVWFVVALPIYFSSQFDWSHWQVGSFMAAWIILYGLVQTQAPRLFVRQCDGRSATVWALMLALVTIAIPLSSSGQIVELDSLIVGLLSFGFFFAVNSSLHSFLIVDYADVDTVSMDVGFYYMANAAGRLLGTILSGLLFQTHGIEACLYASAIMVGIACLSSLSLPRHAQSFTR